MAGIFAVIISFNPDIDLLEKEYESIKDQVELIVYVDNCSKNVSELKTWASNHKSATFIYLKDNEGIGKAQNEGIKYALAKGADHIIIFDQDSIVPETFVHDLYQTEQYSIRNGYNVGLVGPVYKSIDGTYQYPILSVDNNKLKRINLTDFKHYKVVSHIIASGSLIRKQVFDEVGFLNEDLFLGYVDFEYCFRAAKHGYCCIQSKDVCMNHLMGDRQINIFDRKIGIYSPFRRYFDCRNTILIQRIDYIPGVIRRHYLKLIVLKFFISIACGPSRFKQIHYCLKGFYDGIKGVSGKCTIK